MMDSETTTAMAKRNLRKWEIFLLIFIAVGLVRQFHTSMYFVKSLDGYYSSATRTRMATEINGGIVKISVTTTTTNSTTTNSSNTPASASARPQHQSDQPPQETAESTKEEGNHLLGVEKRKAMEQQQVVIKQQQQPNLNKDRFFEGGGNDKEEKEEKAAFIRKEPKSSTSTSTSAGNNHHQSTAAEDEEHKSAAATLTATTAGAEADADADAAEADAANITTTTANDEGTPANYDKEEEVPAKNKVVPVPGDSSIMVKTTSPNNQTSTTEANDNQEAEGTTTPSNNIATDNNDHDQQSPSSSLEELSKIFYQRHYDALSRIPFNDMIVHSKHMDTGQMIDGFWNKLPHKLIQKGRSFSINMGLQRLGNDVDDRRLAAKTADQLMHFESQNGLCDAAKKFNEYRKSSRGNAKPWPHVAIVGLHRDFGALSTTLPEYTGTYSKNDRIKEWNKMGCSSDYILEYVNHNDTLAIITTQFHMWDHPKIHSFPLGVHREYTARDAKKHLKQKGPAGGASRKQLVMVNFNERNRKNRKRILQHLKSSKFAYPDGTKMHIWNTYVKKSSNINRYFSEMVNSKFVLSPGGWGLDCYRNWEALYVGTIPVIEHLNRHDGWYRTFDDLPVAWIDYMTNLTPAWLEKEYERIIRNADKYNWEKLTLHYWNNWVLSFLPRCQNQQNQQQCKGWINPKNRVEEVSVDDESKQKGKKKRKK